MDLPTRDLITLFLNETLKEARDRGTRSLKTNQSRLTCIETSATLRL